MTRQIHYEVQAEASGRIAARREEIWQAISDLARRPNLKAIEPIDGVWPEETARVRVVMDRGDFEMIRTESVVRCVPDERLLIKIEAPEYGSTAWLDHRIDHAAGGWRLTIGVIAIATFPEGAGPKSRDDYIAVTREGLQTAIDLYRARIEGADRLTGRFGDGR